MALRLTKEKFKELRHRLVPEGELRKSFPSSPRPRARSRDLEHHEAVALIKWRDAILGTYPELDELYAIPNAGKRSKAERGRLLDEGLKAGVSDYHLPIARGGYIGLWVELKSPEGEPTDSQLAWLAKMRARGHRAVVCVGWEMARDVLIEYITSGSTFFVGTDRRSL